jgi:hypothetical protein
MILANRGLLSFGHWEILIGDAASGDTGVGVWAGAAIDRLKAICKHRASGLAACYAVANNRMEQHQ